MSYKLAGTDQKDHLYIKVSGCIENSTEDKQYAKEAYDLFTRFDYSRAIIDIRELKLKTNIIDQVKLVDSYSNKKIFPNIMKIKLAVIIDRENEELATFWEDYSTNRGFNFKVFYSISEAESWLTN